MNAIKRSLYAIALAFEYNHELARAKRDAQRNGIDPRTDAEFRAVNGLEEGNATAQRSFADADGCDSEGGES
jgi:hypothetical protein